MAKSFVLNKLVFIMIFLGLVCFCEQNVVGMFTAANYKQPLSVVQGYFFGLTGQPVQDRLD